MRESLEEIISHLPYELKLRIWNAVNQIVRDAAKEEYEHGYQDAENQYQ
jgi:hypothetical protein